MCHLFATMYLITPRAIHGQRCNACLLSTACLLHCPLRWAEREMQNDQEQSRLYEQPEEELQRALIISLFFGNSCCAAAKTINVCANTQSFTYLSHCGKPLFAIITTPLNGSLIMMIMILISGLVTPVSSALIRRRLSCFFSLLIALTCLAPNLTSISQLPIINCVQTRFSQG